VLHPGKVGWHKFLKRACSAIICAYMQMFVPYKMLDLFFVDWAYHGIKTPLWFIGNAAEFANMFIALSALCSLFANKCAENIRVGALANYHIMTHEEPGTHWHSHDSDPKGDPEGMEGQTTYRAREISGVDPLKKAPWHKFLFCTCKSKGNAVAQMSAETDSAPMSPAPMTPKSGIPGSAPPSAMTLQHIREEQDTLKARLMHLEAEEASVKAGYPQMSLAFVEYNQKFWCTLSMTMNILMSLMLFVIIFTKVACFHGKMDDVALIAVALYFVFELDQKVMQSDPKLRPRYRQAVAKQTQQVHPHTHPRHILVAAGVFRALVENMTPIGLAGIVLFSWRNVKSGVVIGGDPF